MASTLRKSTWNTYAISGYTHDLAGDQASAGGCVLHQVRRSKAGWQYRAVQSNGRYRACGPVEPIDDAEGEARFERAKNCN